MLELVDSAGLNPAGATREGSNPSARTEVTIMATKTDIRYIIEEWESLFHRIGPDEDVIKYKDCDKPECLWVREKLMMLNEEVIEAEIARHKTDWSMIEIYNDGEPITVLRRSLNVADLLGVFSELYGAERLTATLFDDKGKAVASLRLDELLAAIKIDDHDERRLSMTGRRDIGQ